MRAIGVTEFLARDFDCFEFDGRWAESFGLPEKNFKMLIYGTSGHGKTEFCIQLAKYISRFAMVYYNTFEEGISRTLQKALIRNKMEEVAGKVIFGDRESFAEMMARLKKRNSPKIVFIDSRDYIHLTADQYRKLVNTFPRKCFIIVCWESAGKPKGEHAKAIEYMVDVKVRVHSYVAHVRSRFGGNIPFDIWPDRKAQPGQQLSIL